MATHPTASDPISGPRSAAHDMLRKPQRILACVLCQQRKVKCDRKFPCAHCVRAKVVCVPGTQHARQRRRRFPERDLLGRIRHYEELLQQNNVDFEPLHRTADSAGDLPAPGFVDDAQQQQVDSTTPNKPSPASTAAKSETHEAAKDFWHAMSQGYATSDCDSDCSDHGKENVDMVNNWNQLFVESDHPFFGRTTAIDLSALHPEPIQILKLWQSYIENVNPLLKVSHTPTLQGRIINAASNMANIDPNLEVLMFGIYCAAAVSVGADCEQLLGEPQQSLLARYQFGCQQALVNAAFLKTTNLECLTGFLLYLVSMRPVMHPRSLSSLLGIAVRTAQRIGLHREVSCASCAVFEAEIRRRLWWSLIMFDARISELADFKTSSLDPTWDCRVPLNINETDLQPAMTDQPMAHPASTDAVFAVVRYELGDFVRHAPFHLNFTTPVLKPLTRSANNAISERDSIQAFSKYIEDKYLKFCDARIPIHFVTLWLTRATLAKYGLYSIMADAKETQTASERDGMISYALEWIEYTTKIIESPLARGFLWFMNSYFPLPAYVRIFNDLKRRPLGADASRCWDVVSRNFSVHSKGSHRMDANYIRIFSNMVLQAWRIRETALTEKKQPIVEPGIVTQLKHEFGHFIQGDAPRVGNLPVEDGMDTELQRSMLAEPSADAQYGALSHNAMGGTEYPERKDGETEAWSPLNWNLVDVTEGHFLS